MANARVLVGVGILFVVGCATGSQPSANDLVGEPRVSETVPVTTQDPTSPMPEAPAKPDTEVEPNEPNEKAGDFEIRCHSFYQDPTDPWLEDRPLPGPRVCTVVVDRSTRYCTIPLGETTCAINVDRPTRIEPTSVDVPTLPGSQARCRSSLTGARARFLCDYGMKPCTSEKSSAAQVMYFWDCDSSHALSITVEGNTRAITVPENSPVTVAWNATAEAGNCKLTSRSVGLEADAGFFAAGAKGTLKTPALSSVNGPYVFTLTCVNANGAVATSSVTAHVEMQ